MSTLLKSYRRLALFSLTFLVLACSDSPRTFAGFTYGGGGNTFSAEPAKLSTEGEFSILEAGAPDDQVYLRLRWLTSSNPKSPLELEEAQVSVKGKNASTKLTSGHIVVQSEIGETRHGSFDFETKTDDGRVLKVVGSFTAR